MKMNSKQKILRHFIENNGDSSSIRSISKKLRINYRIVFEEIEKLKEQGLIEIKKLGNCNLCRFGFKYNEKILKKAEQIIRLIPFDIHLLDFTTEQFIIMLKTTVLNVGKEIVKNNIILYGTENFYEMMNYAK